MVAATKKKPRVCMCRDYLGFGIASVLVGAFFLALMSLVGANAARLGVGLFFVILGVVDLVFYYFLREK